MSPSIEVPLWWRAPNPPSPFIGRDDDVIRLRGLLQRSPVALVWGFSGVGKSALVQAVLHDDADRTLWLRAGGDDVITILHQRLHALGAPAAGGGVEPLAEAIEALGVQVVVDGVEGFGALPSLLALVRLLARHGRRGRLVVICREDPRDVELSTRTLRVAPLPEEALAALVDAVAPGLPPSVRRSMATAAAGSPWRLLQLALDVGSGGGGGMDGGPGMASPDASLLALSPVARGLLATLSLVDEGLPRDVAARATRLPDDEAIRALVRRGWVETVGGALHLHHAARPLVALGVTAEERRRRRQRLLEALLDPTTKDARLTRQLGRGLAADVLADEGPTVARPIVERLLLASTVGGRIGSDVTDDELLRLLALVVGAGIAPRDAALERALIAVGLRVGDAAIARLPLDDTGVEHDDDGALLLLRSRLAHARGHGARARDGLVALLARHDLDEALVAPALALAADRGDLDLIDGSSGRSSSWRSIGQALSGRQLDQGVAAVAALDELARSDLAAPLARGLLGAGRVDDARRLLGGCVEAGVTVATVVLLRAGAAAGEAVDWSVLAGAPHQLVRLEGRLWRLVDRIRHSDDDTAEVDELAALGGALPAPAAPPRLRAILLALRSASGDDRRRSACPDVDAVLAGLQQGDVATDRAGALRLRARARADGDLLRALELGMLVLDLALADRTGGKDGPPDRGHDDDVRALLTTLLGEARALTVPGVVDELRVLATLIDPAAAKDAAAALAALAQSPGRRARRRARALLGDDVVVGPWDRRVLQRGLQGSRAAPAVVVQGTGEREWVVDEARQQIVVGSDVVVDLADKAILLALLVTLLRHGGHATKEQLLVEVWAVREYHPLHHDNRLKVAVRKLRRLLEEVLGDDPIEAGDDGYRLRGRVRFVAAGAS